MVLERARNDGRFDSWPMETRAADAWPPLDGVGWRVVLGQGISVPEVPFRRNGGR
jgi:hypothetical protein